MDDNGEWQNYDKELNHVIAVAAKGEMTFEFINNAGDRCRIDFELMEQQSLEKGGKTRPVRNAAI